MRHGSPPRQSEHKAEILGLSATQSALILPCGGIANDGLVLEETSDKRMLNVTEKTLLKVGTVKITNLRAIFGAKSYQLSNITSASLQTQEANLFIPVFIAISMGICSLLVGLSNLEEFGHWLQIGLYVGIGAILLFLISRKTKYKVQIENPVSKLIVLETDDRGYAERVVTALNKAIETYEEA